jgi:hypothetical protein
MFSLKSLGMADPIIASCWITFYVVWVIGALFTKRTAERAAGSEGHEPIQRCSRLKACA